ncbi:MAG: hypothetical protein EOM56_13415, partial [Deltaproteobacteria bacterium]|nr:hypothetical protein [Deltaproteobacteria bacterium]
MTQFWRLLTRNKAAAEHYSEWVAFAKLAIVMVPGSVEEERVFSAMNFLKNQTRNSLDTHLEDAVRVFTQALYTVHTFPYSQAYKHWLAGAPIRGRYMLG